MLILLEQLGTGSLGEVTFAEKVEVTEETAKYDQVRVHRENNENELDTNNTDLSKKEADELFSLCQDIQNLVDGSDNVLKDVTDTTIDKLINEIPEEVTRNAAFNGDIIDIEQFLEDDNSCGESMIYTSEDSDTDSSSFLEDESSSYSEDLSSLDDVFLELFPSLASV